MPQPCSLERPELVNSVIQYLEISVDGEEFSEFKLMERNGSDDQEEVKVEGTTYFHAIYTFKLYTAICKLNTKNKSDVKHTCFRQKILTEANRSVHTYVKSR